MKTLLALIAGTFLGGIGILGLEAYDECKNPGFFRRLADRLEEDRTKSKEQNTSEEE